MSAVPYESREEEWDRYEDEQELALPGRPRRRYLNRVSAALIALVVGAIGFYVGVRVEKGQLRSSANTASLSGGGRAAAAGAGSGAAGVGRIARAGAGSAAAGAGAGLAGERGAFAGGNSSFGTVSSVNGKTIYVTEPTNGDVVKVQLSSATKVTKNVGVSKSAIRPGDAVVVQGLTNTGGTIAATSVTDTGARPGSAGAGASRTSNSSGSAINSLFGGGG